MTESFPWERKSYGNCWYVCDCDIYQINSWLYIYIWTITNLHTRHFVDFEPNEFIKIISHRNRNQLILRIIKFINWLQIISSNFGSFGMKHSHWTSGNLNSLKLYRFQHKYVTMWYFISSWNFAKLTTQTLRNNT